MDTSATAQSAPTGEAGTSRASARALAWLFLVPLALKAALVPVFALTYDEAAYARTASRLVATGGWLHVGNEDLFFWPPLYNYLVAAPIALGVDRLFAARGVTILLSSAIAPLLFLLVSRAGYGRRAAWLAAVLWTINPWALCYSVVGQPETPMLAFVLLALLLLLHAREDGRGRTALLAAAALAGAIALKETALGLAPLFPLFLWRQKRAMVAWCLGFALLLAPLLVPSTMPGVNGLFFEIANPAVRWSTFNLGAVLKNLARIHGLELTSHGPTELAASLLVLGVLTVSLGAAWRRMRAGDPLLRLLALALLLYVAFFAAFWKTYTYYTLMLYVLWLPFVGLCLGARWRWGWLYVAVTGALGLKALVAFADRHAEADLVAALRTVEAEHPHASVVMSMPRKAEYLADRHRIAVRVAPEDWVQCRGRFEACFVDCDYLLGEGLALRTMIVAAFCPPDTTGAGCNHAAGRALGERLMLAGTFGDLDLYRLRRPSPPPTPPAVSPTTAATAPAASDSPARASYPPPEADYPAERLHERVDGAAELLRSSGCYRLLYWRLTEPAADLEVLGFDKPAGATEMLDRDSGKERTAGTPGDEGWANAQVVYFRRGAIYVRLIADQAAAPGVLLEQARRLDRALAAGEVKLER